MAAPAPGVSAPQNGSSIVQEARERAEHALAIERENRNQAYEDLKFLAGNQWDALVLRERQLAYRPTLTSDRLMQVVKQVTGEFRRNPPAIRVLPSDQEATADAAHVLAGVIRAEERASRASRVYINALTSAVSCGIGHMRLSLEYESESSFDLCLRIRGIANPFAVLWGDYTEDDRSDAGWGLAFDELDAKQYARETGRSGSAGSWYVQPWSPQPEMPRNGRGKTVRRVEYWRVVRDPVKLMLLRHASGATSILQDPDRELLAEAAGEGWRVIDQRDSTTKRIEAYHIVGSELVGGPYLWPGQRIPLFTVDGEVIQVGDYTYRASLIRGAKDGQRLVNLAHSIALESYSLAPKQKWLVTAKHQEGREAEWAYANASPKHSLTYNPDPNAPPPQLMQPQLQGLNSVLELAAVGADAIKAGTGIYDASLGARSNETSGVAIEARKAEGDISTYVYIDNALSQVQAIGRAMVNLIPGVYSGRRMLRILGEDERPAIVDLAARKLSLNGKYDVVVETGPGFTTKRAESAALLKDLIGNVPPPMQAVLVPEVVRLLDLQGAEQLSQKLMQAAQSAGLIPPPPGQAPPGAPAAAPELPPQIAELLASIPAPRPGERLPPEVEEMLAAIEIGGPGSPDPFASPGPAPAGTERVGPRPPVAGPAGIQGAFR